MEGRKCSDAVVVSEGWWITFGSRLRADFSAAKALGCDEISVSSGFSKSKGMKGVMAANGDRTGGGSER